jgi:hypothetical protein
MKKEQYHSKASAKYLFLKIAGARIARLAKYASNVRWGISSDLC